MIPVFDLILQTIYIINQLTMLNMNNDLSKIWYQVSDSLLLPDLWVAESTVSKWSRGAWKKKKGLKKSGIQVSSK